MKDENGLTPKMALFVQFYCGECRYNGTQSCIKAGYKGSNGTMRWLANKLLTNSNIKSIITKKLADISEKAEITQERIAQEISDVAFGRITFTVGFQANMANKLKALELLGRYKAMFTDNLSTTDTQKQRELDDAERIEAERIATVLNREDIERRYKEA